MSDLTHINYGEQQKNVEENNIIYCNPVVSTCKFT